MEFQLSMPMNIEWYSGGDTNSDDYVKKKCFRHPAPRRRRLGMNCNFSTVVFEIGRKHLFNLHILCAILIIPS